MKSFLEEFTQRCLAQYPDLSQHTFVLPSRRAVNFLKKELVKQQEASHFLPRFFSIEEFVADVAEVELIDTITVLFEFYGIYLKVFPADKQESFETVYNWSQTLLQDFNEIDRHLIDAEDFFGNLANVKEIEHWSKAENPTPMVKNYLAFWRILPTLYTHLTSSLIEKKQVYQGLAYKLAVQNFDTYVSKNNQIFHFVGFNALNACEQAIFQKTLQLNRGEVVWDIDAHFLKDPQHPASTFMQAYQKQWKVSPSKPYNILPSTEDFTSPKQFFTYAIPKKIGQAKMVGQLLADLSPNQYSTTAVVLADENLLQPILNAIPETIQQVNVTMGLALAYTPLASLFHELIRMHLNEKEELFYKDIFLICEHPSFTAAFAEESSQLRSYFTENTILFISSSEFFEYVSATYAADFFKAMQLAFSPTHNHPMQLLKQCSQFALLLASLYQEDTLNLQYMHRFQKLFIQLTNVLSTTTYVETNRSLFSIYKDLLSFETLDFQGSPFQGIQVMGMLETRVLDFENLIITSVNEGILPQGKTENSYLPFDLKIAFNLPTYKDKDAVYAYHFFRLLQRAKNVHLLYNNDMTSVEKAEPSRFIRYLEVFPLPQHSLQQAVVSASTSATASRLETIPKTPRMMQQLEALFTYGISPSALTSYIRNPLDFYKSYLLHLDEVEEIEEEVSYRVYGNILHDTLQELYEPYQNKPLQKEDIMSFRKQYTSTLQQQFSQHFNAKAITKGKNLIQFEIAKQQCDRFFEMEWQTLTSHSLQLISIEKSRKISISIDGVAFPVYLKGKADRVDKIDDTYRIIDYKTGKVNTGDVLITPDWNNFTMDYKYSKAFQVLFYALLFQDELNDAPLQSGIISFKNLNEGFMPFGIKSTTTRGEKNYDVTAETLEEFKVHLKELIKEILNPNIPFQEKEIK